MVNAITEFEPMPRHTQSGGSSVSGVWVPPFGVAAEGRRRGPGQRLNVPAPISVEDEFDDLVRMDNPDGRYQRRREITEFDSQ